MSDVNARAFGGLERDVAHLTDRIEKLEDAIKRLEGQVGRLSDLLNQAKGARWLLGLLVVFPSLFVGWNAAVSLWDRVKP